MSGRIINTSGNMNFSTSAGQAAPKNYVGGNSFYSTPPPGGMNSIPQVAATSGGDEGDEATMYEALVDEVRHFEEQHTAAIEREQFLSRALNAVADYAHALEGHIIVPAMGDLTIALGKYHDAALARSQGTQALSAAESQGAITPTSHPQAARMLAALRRPTATAIRNAQRNQALSQELRGGPNAAEDALVMASGMLNATEELQALLSEALKATNELQHSGGSAPFQTGAVQPSGGNAADTQREVLALRKEVQLTQQNCDSKLELANQEKELLSLKHEGSAQVIQRLENDNKTLQLRIEALGVKENLAEQASDEKHRLQRRVDELEQVVQQNAQDKLEVAQRFETLQRYIEQAAVNQNHTISSNAGVVPSSPPSNNIRTVPAAEFDAQLIENAKLKEQLSKLQASTSDEIALLRQQLVTTQQKVHQLDGRAGGIDEFTKELQRLRNARAGSPLDDGPESVQSYKAKLKVFEMTVTALNAELSALEEKLMVIERNAVDDRRRLLNEMEQEKLQHREEQSECDAVVQRITTELEALMKENSQLKNRLREYHKQLTQSE